MYIVERVVLCLLRRTQVSVGAVSRRVVSQCTSVLVCAQGNRIM
jgi:hypothetical protein